jgi:hypothetical protein
MPTYYYKAEKGSTKRGKDGTISIYTFDKEINEFELIGKRDVWSGSHRGDKIVANELLSQLRGYRINKGGYSIKNKRVKLIALP